MLKAKEREVECLRKDLTEKDDLLNKYSCQIEDLKTDLQNKCSKYRDLLKKLKAIRGEGSRVGEDNYEADSCEDDSGDFDELLQAIVRSVEEQKKSIFYQFQNFDCQMKALTAEKKIFLKERADFVGQLQRLKLENDQLTKDLNAQKKTICEKEELIKAVDVLKSEKNELLEKVNTLHDKIQELNKNFKETRWALTAEVAEKHDQVQDLKRCVGTLEDQLRQADMQTHFKDDIIKELRKELKASKKSLLTMDSLSKMPSRDNSPPKLSVSQKKSKDDELKVDIHIFPINDSKPLQPDQSENEKFLRSHSVEVQTELSQSLSASNIRNVATQHKTRVQKLPRSFGTLTVTPWSGAAGEERRGFYDVVNELKSRKNECGSAVTFVSAKGVSSDMSKSQRSVKCRDGEYNSTTSIIAGKHDLNAMSTSESNFTSHYAALASAISKIEEMLRTLSSRQNCGLSDCRETLEEEVEKIRAVKDDLERCKSKNLLSKFSSKNLEGAPSDPGTKCLDSSCGSSNKCTRLHIQDMDKFREKAVTGVVALEQMKEQIGILENLIKKYVEEFPCDCDKSLVEECEEKLEKLHEEFDDITDQLCCALQELSRPSFLEGSFESSFTDDMNSQKTFSVEICRLKSEHLQLQKEICDRENAIEKLRQTLNQLEDKLQQKRCQLNEQCRELDSRACEIFKFRELIRRVCHRLRELQCEKGKQLDQKVDCLVENNAPNLTNLFSDLQEFWFLLEMSMDILTDAPNQLKSDNDNLREKVVYLQKCIGNKDETLRLLQETVKLRECQIEELKCKIQSSEHQSSKLAQDVEDKCHLISKLQEAVRKSKQFEVDAEVIESLQFECCDLEYKLKKYQKEIILKDSKMESLHNELMNLSSKNLYLTQKLKIINPKLTIMYKTCHLFEATVNELQEELNHRECEVDGLYGKIKDLENELESEFKKCEDRAAEDSKCIENLSATLKTFQNELYCANESYNRAIIETENRLKKEMELKEMELKDTICRLKGEIKDLRCQQQESPAKTSPKNPQMECLARQIELQQKMYEKKIIELQNTLECVADELDQERKNFLQKLCEEKNHNVKNKAEITRLNASMKCKIHNESVLKECIEHITEDYENLKTENQELRTEIEARKRIMSAMEKGDGTVNLTELEELICSLKIQKAELKTKCCNLKGEVNKEIKLKRLLKCRVDELNEILQNKTQEFNKMMENYDCTAMRIRQTHAAMKELEESLMRSSSARGFGNIEEKNCDRVSKLMDLKTAENAKLLCQIEILKVEIESIQNENAALHANKDALISGLQLEVQCLESDIHDFQKKCQYLTDENLKLQKEIECWSEKEMIMETEFKEKQKELCARLRATLCEKNELLSSLDELQRQLEEMSLENVNKEKLNKKLSEECSRLKANSGGGHDKHVKNKSDKINYNLSKELKNLHCELTDVKENYRILSEEYHSLREQLNCCEKKKANIEKLYTEVCDENKELQELRASYERELCEAKTQNQLLKDKIGSKGECLKGLEDKRKMCDKIKELSMKIKTLEKKVIPELEQELEEKNCHIENLKMEIKEANVSCQRMKTEALKMIQLTKRYLAAQRCANDSLKARLECSNKRGNCLGAENRELEEQLKAVTQMNEFLLCQLEATKSNVGGTEPRSFSPMPWGCSMVERDTSSSEYLAESGIQSMQPSPTNLDYHDNQYDFKRNCPQTSCQKKCKHGSSVEYPCDKTYRNGIS